MLPEVVSVEASGPCVMQVTFSDGIVTEVDMTDDLRGTMTEPLKDPAFLAQVFVDEQSGAVTWPNGFDLDSVVLHGDFPAAEPSRLVVRRITDQTATA